MHLRGGHGRELESDQRRFRSDRRDALEELLGSAPDAPVPLRYLRQLYPDPMTGTLDWALVPAPGGGIMGVASRSTRAPLKTGQFDLADAEFAEAKSYGDWQFTFATGRIHRMSP